MGLIFGLIKRLIKLFIYFIIFAALITLVPNLPPYTKFSSIKLEPTQPRTGPLASNGLLNNAQQLYKGKLAGPEAFQIYNDELYTSLGTGEIVKISPGGHVTFVTKIGQPCTGHAQEHKCGRPLGFEIDTKTKSLIIADAYLGIWKVDLNTDKKQLLVSPRVEIEGRTPKLFNSLALAKNGDIFWTDSSSDFNLKDGLYTAFVDPSGRLFQYSPAKNQSKVLLDNLWFANGVVLSPDNKFVLVSESNRFRILKYYIEGSNKGNAEVFVAGLPGVVDNLRVLPDGSGVLLGLYSLFDDDNPMISKSLSETPHVRKFFARLLRLAEIPFEYLNSVYPHYLLEEIVSKIGSFQSVSGLAPPFSGVLQLDWNGNIVALYDNNDGSMKHVSDAIVYNGKLLTGAPHNHDFVGAVPAPPLLLSAFAVKGENKEVPKVAPKVQQPKPVVQEKPKIQPKVEEPKQTQPKPTQAPPKQTEKKPVETAPPPKPTPAPPKPTVAPVKTQPPKKTPEPEKPQATPKPAVKTTTPKPEVKSPKPEVTTPKPEKPKTPEVKQTPPSKPTPTPALKTTPPPKEPKATTQAPPTTKPVEKTKKLDKKENLIKEDPPKRTGEKVTQEIPIREEIPSDTAKPSKEKLKVIKKGGPAEIPNPNL